MNSLESIKISLKSGGYDAAFRYIRKDESERERYLLAISHFERTFGKSENAYLFSSPGRTEICGNHTDHQGGCALAAAINADIIAVVSPNNSSVIRILSEGHSQNYVNLSVPFDASKERGSTPLVRGVADYLAKHGYKVGGFDAYTTSIIPTGSGLSSSAAYEVLIGAIINRLFNDNSIPAKVLARAGQVAENDFYGKPCGLLDQTAVALGGCAYMDFANDIAESVTFSPDKFGYDLILTNTHSSHSDLSHCYGAIKDEMGAVAAQFGAKILSQLDKDEFYAKLPTLYGKLPDRAILRAIHYFEENCRVAKAYAHVKADNFGAFLGEISKSGASSFMYLQNIYAEDKTQPLSVALALSQSILDGCGAFRVHGGGFGGSIQAYVPHEKSDRYIAAMNAVFGDGAATVYKVRPCGPILLDDINKED